MTKSTFTALVTTLTLATLATSIAFASGGHRAEAPAKPLEPANRYSGRTPVDLKNGVPFNNGTYGKPNETYEKFASKTVLPGVSDQSYPFNMKADFVRGLEESAFFVEDAIENWKVTTANTKPEAKDYSDKAVATMQPVLAKYRDQIRKVASAGRNDWDNAQNDARRSLVELRSTYSSLHKNVR